MRVKKYQKVAIIVVVFKPNLKLLKECLLSLKKNTSYKNYKVIVVDNGSKDGSQEVIKKRFKWVDLIENEKNLYWAGGNNVGIKYALKKYNPDYIFLLNDDTKIIQKDWLSKLVETAESDEKIGIVGPKIIYPDGKPQHFGGYVRGFLITVDTKNNNREKYKEVDHIMGSAMMIKKVVIKKIGLIDEIFTPYLLDETDYCLRAKRAGFKVISQREVKIIHHKGQTINKNKETTISFIRFKNDSLFSFINLKFPYYFMRVFVYLPIVTLLKKKDEKEPISIRNIGIRRDIWASFITIFRGYWYVLSHLELIYKKRKERILNMRYF